MVGWAAIGAKTKTPRGWGVSKAVETYSYTSPSGIMGINFTSRIGKTYIDDDQGSARKVVQQVTPSMAEWKRYKKQ